MYPSIVRTTIGGFGTLILENAMVRTVLIPGFGARIVSLIYKPTETEFAWHDPRVPIKKATYEIEYENVNGLFDCLPSTESCMFKGKKLPAGGEVLYEPWDVVSINRGTRSISVHMRCTCKIYPLSIRKRLSISRNEASLRLDYKLRNLSNERLEYHYSGHNTLCINPGNRILLPHEVSKLKVGFSADDRLGKMGDEIPWPETVDRHNKTVDLSKVGDPCARTAENLYTSRLRDSWCALINEDRMEAIGFSFTAERLPHQMLWANYGGWRDYYHIALEPLSGRPDNLEVAVNNWKDFLTIDGKEEVSWAQRIFVAHDVRHVERIDADEGIIQ